MILLTLSLLAATPRQDAAIRDYYRQKEQARSRAEAVQLDATIPRLSAAGEVLKLPVNSQILLPDGRTLTLSGALDVTISEPQPTPPPPPGPALVAIIREGSTAPLLQATAGEELVAIGTGFTDTPQFGGRLVLAGKVATIRSWTDRSIRFVVPDPGPTAISGPVILYLIEGSQWSPKTRLAAFTLLPKAAPLPPNPPGEGEPMVERLEDVSGRVITEAVAGQPLVIVGKRFGSQPGRAMVDKWEARVRSWEDGKIVLEGGPWGGQKPGLWLWLPGRGWTSFWSGGVVLGP